MEENKMLEVHESQEFMYDWFSKEKNVPSCVFNCLQNMIEEKINENIAFFEVCESPLEQIMCLRFMNLYRDINDFGCKRVNKYFENMSWCSQADIKSELGNFRADFLIDLSITSYDKYNIPYSDNHRIIIECDGIQYHYKDKATINKTLDRDRTLKLLGFEVIHFSGDEIMKKGSECYDYVVDYISNLFYGKTKCECEMRCQ